MAAQGLPCYTGAFSALAESGLVAVWWLLIEVASLAAEHRL